MFWSYVIAALQTAASGLGANFLGALKAGEPPGEPLLADLINDLHAEAHDIDLVLDDYHVIERPEIHEGVGFLLERMPPRMLF